MKSLAISILLLLAAAGRSAATGRPPVLPKDVAGWRMQGTAKTSTDPGVADPAYAALLKEYGFTDLESANYRREDGRTLAIKAARFESTSGAVGAYTFYRQPGMQKEQIGDWGSSFNQRILFFRGNVLIDAVFDRVTAMSAAELRQLAGLLPRPTGSTANTPPILAYMPSSGRIKNTEKYVIGPLALSQLSSPIPVPLVDFAAGAEVVMAKYSSAGGDATLMVINYPTPQIAAEHMRRIAIKRLLPDRIFDRREEMEFISLHLEESPVQPSDSGAKFLN